MRSALLLGVLCACGSAGNQQTDAAAGPHDVFAFDGFDGPSAPPCQLTAPFSTPVNVAGVNSNSTDSWGWLTPDQLTIYFTSAATSSSNTDIYTATRTSVSASFVGVTQVVGLSSGNTEDRPVPSADGLAMYFDSNVGGGNVHLYVSTRATSTDTFATPIQLSGPTSSAIDTDPWVTPDGQMLYFSSTRDAVGDYNIFQAPNAGSVQTFGPVTEVTELNAQGNVETAPVVSADGLEIFFASDRMSAHKNVWHATRAAVANAFGTPTKVTELSLDASDDFVTWISADRCTVLLTSDRTGGNGGLDIWMAKRPQ